MIRTKEGWLDGASWTDKTKQKTHAMGLPCYLLSEHAANHSRFEHPVLCKPGELGHLTNLIHMSFGELCFLLRFWVQTKWALAAACIGGTGAAARALIGTIFLSFFVAVVSTHGFVLQKSVQLPDPRGSHQAPNPEKTTPNLTLFGVCSLLERGKSILGLLRCA